MSDTKTSNQDKISENAYEYLNCEVKPLFIPIITKAIKHQPKNSVKY